MLHERSPHIALSQLRNFLLLALEIYSIPDLVIEAFDSVVRLQPQS
jgi:hypothetical protein